MWHMVTIIIEYFLVITLTVLPIIVKFVKKILFRPIMKKTVMVTGATSGIGRACALKFGKAGYRVIVTGRRADALAELSAELADAGAESLVLCVRRA